MNKTLTKLMLDIILTILFISLIYPRETGFTFHEIAGLVSGALVIFHVIINWSWVKSITRSLFNPKVKAKAKLFYLLNALSSVVLVGIIITGIQISIVLFPVGGIANSSSMVIVHKWLSYSCLGLFGLHVALHWGFFAHTVPRMFKSPGRPASGKVALNLSALVITLVFLFSQMGFIITNETIQPIANQETIISNDVVSGNKPQPLENSVPQIRISSNPPADTNKTVAQVAPTTVQISTPSGSTNTSSSSIISSGTSNNSTVDQITLTQYLSNIYCTGCSKHCSLLSPQCSTGISQATVAMQKYTAIYGTAMLN
ncbi:MAG: cytochrome b/b6 domain-containing protein [Firmicutes bacterium]|nr:cytochrome b/b6 domain-containing protein [Bacillota bacterium]